jgi:D-xylose transport system permease protein
VTTTDATPEVPSAAAAEPEVVAPKDLVRRTWDNLRSGELGSWPIIIGLVAVGLFFHYKSAGGFHSYSAYISASNFNNLIVQMAGLTMVAFGVVFVLLIGEIDLSVGYLSGFAGVIVGELTLAASGHDLPGLLAIACALAAGALLGAAQGAFVAYIGVPSFVVTLAGLLLFQGLILRSLPESVIIIDDKWVNDIANYFFSPTAAWIIAGVASAVYAFTMFGRLVSHRHAGIRWQQVVVAVAKVLAVTGIACFVAYKSSTDPGRGLPFAALLILVMLALWTFVAKRTTFGRHVYAVGGNAEAARRAGINVARIRILVFMISGTMAALGGVVFASRLRSVDLSAGGGTILLDAISAAVIGGVSLFGGRGEPKAAVLGALIITMVANGIDLVGYSPSTKLITTAIILLAAVTLDTISRRRQEQVGR